MISFLEFAKLYKITQEQVEVEKIRRDFVKKFPIDKIKDMDIKNYAIGFGNTDNFCYGIENKLNKLGNIHGATSNKFGVYFDKKKNEYHWTKWTNSNFSIVTDALSSLMFAGKNQDIEGITKNPLSPMLKGKILSVYFPERYMNVYADYHLHFFLKKLNITYNGEDLIILREKIFEYKNLHEETKNFSAVEFGYLLYAYYGSPSKEKIEMDNKRAEEVYDSEQKSEVNEKIINNKESRMFLDIPIKKPEKININNVSVYKRKNDKSVQAIKNAEFLCEYNNEHVTFLRKDGKTPYTEAHHLIPMSAQDDFEFSLDTPSNIISLCSNCHNLVHYGINYGEIINKIYELRKERLKKSGIEIDIKKLLKYYK